MASVSDLPAISVSVDIYSGQGNSRSELHANDDLLHRVVMSDETRGSLTPFVYALGLVTGLGASFLASHPSLFDWVFPTVVACDTGVYTFFIWLFAPDFRAQWKVRIEKLRGQVGFKWQTPDNRRKLI